jgi:hypothetical protein
MYINFFQMDGERVKMHAFDVIVTVVLENCFLGIGYIAIGVYSYRGIWFDCYIVNLFYC